MIYYYINSTTSEGCGTVKLCPHPKQVMPQSSKPISRVYPFLSFLGKSPTSSFLVFRKSTFRLISLKILSQKCFGVLYKCINHPTTACPQCTHEQIKDLIDNKVNPPATGTMTPAQAGEKCGKKCDTFKSTDQQPKNDQAGQPEDPESDNCSAQAQRLETFSNCIDEKEGAQKVTVKEGSTDPLGPDSEMYGGSARTCGQVAAGGGGYFGVKQGAIDCEQSQQAYGCNFIGIVYISSTQGLFSKKCQQVQGSGENNLGLQCPSISG